MEKPMSHELSWFAEQRFRTAVRDCLACAQERLVQEVQRLTAEISASVSDEVVQLHANVARELLSEDSCQAARSLAPLDEESSEQSQLGARPKLLPPLVIKPDLPGQVNKPCSNKSWKRKFKVAVHAVLALQKLEKGAKNIQRRVIADGVEQLREAAHCLESPASFSVSGLPDTHCLESTTACSVSGPTAISYPSEGSNSSGKDKRVRISISEDKHNPDVHIEESLSPLSPPGSQRPSHQFISPSLRRAGSKASTSSMETSTTSANKISLQPVWMEARIPARRRSSLNRAHSKSLCQQISSGSTRSAASLQSAGSSGSLRFMTHAGSMRRCIMRPGHPFCIIWDLLTAVAMIHDVVIIPLLAFDLPESMALKTMEVVTSVVWSVDLFLSFFRGVADNEEGVIEMRPKKIARIYLRSWFPLDFVVVVVDVLLLCMSSSSWVEVILLVRMLRILRMARIAKIMKISERLTIFQGKFADMVASSEKRAAGLSILKLVLIMVVVNHFAACGWYGIGSLGQGRHWVQVHFDDLDDASSLSYRYGTSFHWALTQLTPASMEVTPVNTLERAYNILIIFGGMLMFSAVISAVTQTQLYIQQITSAEKQQRQAVQRYIVSNGVSIGLSSSILLFLKSRKDGLKKQLLERDVAAFANLPENMIMSLRIEVFAPTLVGHGVFALMQNADMHSLSMICHNAILEKCILRSQDVFQFSSKANHMYFVSSGGLAYFLGYEVCAEQIVSRGGWVGEPILWIEWEHAGRLSGESRCSVVLQVNASQFHRFASQSECTKNCRAYARVFAQEAAKELDFVTDLWSTPERVRSWLGRSVSKPLPAAEEGCKKALMMWSGPITARNVLYEWKKLVEDRKRRRSRWYLVCCSWLRRRRQKPPYSGPEEELNCPSSMSESSWKDGLASPSNSLSASVGLDFPMRSVHEVNPPGLLGG